MLSLVKKAISDYKKLQTPSYVISLNVEQDFSCIGEENLILHVFYNLLKNVMDHAGTNAELTIFLCENQVVFTDNGKGIEREKLAKITDEFYSSKQGNTGVGLAFCKVAMERMYGKIAFDTQPRRYTRITLLFNREIN